MVSLGEVSVLVGLPGDGVGDALPGVAVAACPHVVARLGLVARVGDAVLDSLNAVGCFVPEEEENVVVVIRSFLQYTAVTEYCEPPNKLQAQFYTYSVIVIKLLWAFVRPYIFLHKEEKLLSPFN